MLSFATSKTCNNLCEACYPFQQVKHAITYVYLVMAHFKTRSPSTGQSPENIATVKLKNNAHEMPQIDILMFKLVEKFTFSYSESNPKCHSQSKKK